MKKLSLTVVVPVYNEEFDLPLNIPKLEKFMEDKMSAYDWKILIADNASTDKTPEIGRKLARAGKVRYLRLEKKGRGRALKHAWRVSDSNFLSYMDIDLSSDIAYFPKLIAALEKNADIAIGSRLAPGARVYNRPFLREVMSRSYSFLFRTLFKTSFRDAQCGFKAIKKDVANKVLPLVRDTSWFFDSELLIIADKAGFKISEVPIVWKDDPASTVKVAKTAWGDIEGLARLFFTHPWKNLKIKN